MSVFLLLSTAQNMPNWRGGSRGVSCPPFACLKWHFLLSEIHFLIHFVVHFYKKNCKTSERQRQRETRETRERERACANSAPTDFHRTRWLYVVWYLNTDRYYSLFGRLCARVLLQASWYRVRPRDWRRRHTDNSRVGRCLEHTHRKDRHKERVRRRRPTTTFRLISCRVECRSVSVRFWSVCIRCHFASFSKRRWGEVDGFKSEERKNIVLPEVIARSVEQRRQ